LHSAAGRGSLYNFFKNSSNLESHFWIAEDGTIEQYIDTEIKADANLKANSFAVSIETESSVQATEPWTNKQTAAIMWLLDWLCDTHPEIKRQQCDKWNGSGIGWHIMFGAPGPWTPVSKSCPGPARIKQMTDMIIPTVCAGGSTPTPTPPKEPFTVAQFDEIMAELKEQRAILNKLDSDYLTKGMSMRQEILETRAEVDPSKPKSFANRTIDSLTRIEAE